MKKLLLLSLFLAFTAGIHAQTSDKKWGVGASVGAYGTLNNANVGFMPELYLSRYLSPRLDVMLKGDLGLFNSDLNNNLDLANPFLNLRFKLTDETKKLRPYLFAGPGYLADNGTSGLNFDAGLGGKYYLDATTAVYLEAGYIHGIESTAKGITGRENLWKASFGLEFNLGKTPDSDMDGVSDKKDKCPNTPSGVAVDVNGCPVDTDGDGVADYIDNCPTVAGLTSLKGCPDMDRDGVADKDDACPEVAGIAALKGCPDTDGDGVTDSNDKCTGTKKGYKVDATGCPIDSDQDGLVNEEDDCPTVSGPKDNKGCPVPVVEKYIERIIGKNIERVKEVTADQIIIQNIKTQPIHFESNKSYLTDYSKNIMNKLLKILNDDKGYHVNMFGYADSQGPEDKNIQLSQDRVNTATDYLIANGIAKERIIQQKAFGEAKPVASNDTEEGRLRNRRVEFEIFKMK